MHPTVGRQVRRRDQIGASLAGGGRRMIQGSMGKKLFAWAAVAALAAACTSGVGERVGIDRAAVEDRLLERRRRRQRLP
jgi:hypothetical protein